MEILYLIKFTLILIICACCICGQHVNCQQQKYKQLQYQMLQQQQQLLYQQQVQQQQQQQQQHYLQQYEKEQQKRYQQQKQQQQQQQHHFTQEQKQYFQQKYQQEEDQHQQQQKQKHQQQAQLSSVPTLPTIQQNVLHSSLIEASQEQQPQMQMLKTSASLVVGDSSQADEASIEQLGQKEYYASAEQQQEQQPQRRPLGVRKRKRRPQLTVGTATQNERQYHRGHVEDDTVLSSAEDSQVSSSNLQPLRKRKQPGTLEQEQRPYELSDKQRQQFLASEAIETNNKAYRRPYAQAKKDQQQQQPATILPSPPSTSSSSNAIDLKNILKNAGGLSLSEILQQKNLSLDDLIKGKQNALLALQNTAATPATHESGSKSNKRKSQTPNEEQHDSSIESTGTADLDDELLIGRPKFKFPAVNRIKLFGGGSRPAVVSHNNFDTTTRKAAPTTTTTTTTTSTTRMPLYKKRQQLRSTLKPPAFLKPGLNSQTATTVNRDTGTTLQPVTLADQHTTTERNSLTAESSQETTEDNETMTTINVPSYKRHPTTPRRTTFERRTTAKPTTARASTTTTASSISSNSTGRYSSTTYRNNLKHRNNIRDKLKGNSIDQEEPTSPALTTAPDQLINDTSLNSREQEPPEDDDDDLENFEFEESETKTLPTKSTTISSLKSIYEYFPIQQVKKSKPTRFEDETDDRTDLLELIEDRRSGNRLFKVLEQRNMTLEELIEHRKRGSSQLHLSTIVEDNSRLFPEQKVLLQDNMDIVTAFENFPHFNLMNLKSVKPDDIKTDSQGSSYFTSIIDIEPTDEAYKSPDGSSSSINNIGKVPNYQRSEKSFGFFPSWKSLASLASLATTARNLNGKRNSYYVQQPKLLLESNSKEDLNDDNYPDQSNDTTNDQLNSKSTLDTMEIIGNDLARAHDLLDLELSGHGFKRSPAAAAATSSYMHRKNGSLYANLPAGIRSAIVASSAIVLTSIVTFMVIFAVCRWKQRQRRRTTYLKTYNSMKSKLPTITQVCRDVAIAAPTTSRRSSLQNIEEMIGSIATVTTTTLSPTTSALTTTRTDATQQQQKELQRQCSLLFPRGRNFNDFHGGISVSVSTVGGNSTPLNTTPATFFRNHTNNLFGTRRCSGSHMTSVASAANSGLGSHTGSTTSLALSLRSAHSISSTKLNAMDTNSPEVQEYLFDTLRKSYD